MLIVEKYFKRGKKWNIPYRDKFKAVGWRQNIEIE